MIKYPPYRRAFANIKAFASGNFNSHLTWKMQGNDSVDYVTPYLPELGNNVIMTSGVNVTLTQDEECSSVTFPEQHTVGGINRNGFILDAPLKYWPIEDGRIGTNPIYSPITISNGYVSTGTGVKTDTLDRDFIVYCKGKLNDASAFFHLNLYNTGGALQYQMSFGYDWTTTTNDSTSMSIKEVSPAQTYKFGDIDLTVTREIILWYDSKWKYFNLYVDNVLIGSWSPTNATLLTVTQCKLASNSSALYSSDIDYFYSGRPLIIVVGDSITGGAIYHAPNPAHYAGVDDFSNTYLFNLMLEIQSRGFKNYFIVNKGVNGDKTADMQSRFAADVTNNAPTYTLIHGGINDWATHANPATTCATKITMHNLAVAASSTAYLIGVCPIGASNAIATFATSLYSEEQTAFLGYKYIPLFKKLATTSNLADAGTLEADNIHPTKAVGYERVSEALIESLLS